MSQISAVLRSSEGQVLSFWCPGCNTAHSIRYGPEQWTWDGNAERPTFSPSVLWRWDEWVGEGQTLRHYVCHSFVRAGRIEFLGDCTHALVGQTVDLPAWPVPDVQGDES